MRSPRSSVAFTVLIGVVMPAHYQALAQPHVQKMSEVRPRLVRPQTAGAVR